jgi:hypothetical protein
LYNAHDTIDGSAHIVGAEFADEFVKFRRGWADAKKERYLNKYNDEGAHPATLVRSLGPVRTQGVGTVQAYDAERNNKVGVEDVGDAQRKA